MQVLILVCSIHNWRLSSLYSRAPAALMNFETFDDKAIVVKANRQTNERSFWQTIRFHKSTR